MTLLFLFSLLMSPPDGNQGGKIIVLPPAGQYICKKDRPVDATREVTDASRKSVYHAITNGVLDFNRHAMSALNIEITLYERVGAGCIYNANIEDFFNHVQNGNREAEQRFLRGLLEKTGAKMIIWPVIFREDYTEKGDRSSTVVLNFFTPRRGKFTAVARLRWSGVKQRFMNLEIITKKVDEHLKKMITS